MDGKMSQEEIDKLIESMNQGNIPSKETTKQDTDKKDEFEGFSQDDIDGLFNN